MTNVLNAHTPPPLVAIDSASNAGGEGKTTIALALEAALDLLGRPVLLIDIDQGMGSLAYQRPNAKALDWTWGHDKADTIIKGIGNNNVVFDFGANTLASGSPVVRLHEAVTEALADVGYRRIALVPITPNKPGAVGAAKSVMRAFSHIECHAVLVNRDGSGAYDEDVSSLDAIHMAHLDPLLQQLRANFQKNGISLADALRSPPPGWTYATNRLGCWFKAFTTQPRLIDILGGNVGEVLKDLGRTDPPEVRLRGMTLDDLHDDRIDDMLRLNAFGSAVQKDDIWRILDRYGLTPSGLRAAADELEQRPRR